MYQLNVEAAKEADSFNSRINDNCKAMGQFTRAESIRADSGTIGIEFDFKSVDGRSATFSLYTLKQDGTQLFGYKQLMAILACLRIKEAIQPEQVQVEKYSFDEKKTIKTIVPAFRALMGKPIGIVFQKELFTYSAGQKAGQDGERVNFFAAFDKDGFTAKEILERVPKPENLDKVMSMLKTRDSRKAPNPAAGGFGGFTGIASDPFAAPAASSSFDLDDSIPF